MVGTSRVARRARFVLPYSGEIGPAHADRYELGHLHPVPRCVTVAPLQM
jgi:hypothetical protein